MRATLTRAEYLRANAKPKRRYRALALTASGATLQGPTRAPCYWFERDDVAEIGDTGKYVRDTSFGIISLVVDGKAAAFFYLAGRRIDTCTFAYDLTPAQLANAVIAMRQAKLQRLIRPAAEWALREMPIIHRPVLGRPLRALIVKPPRKGRPR